MIPWEVQQKNDIDWYKADINKNISLHLNCDYFTHIYENYCKSIHGRMFHKSLDIGISNTGGYTAIIPGIKKRFGLDPAVNWLRENDMLPLTTHINYINGLGEEMPFADKSFDFIIITNALDHVKDMAQTVKEIERVTKDRAIVLFATYLKVKKPHPWTLNSEKEARNMFRNFRVIENHTIVDKRPFFKRNDMYLAILEKV